MFKRGKGFSLHYKAAHGLPLVIPCMSIVGHLLFIVLFFYTVAYKKDNSKVHVCIYVPEVISGSFL